MSWMLATMALSGAPSSDATAQARPARRSADDGEGHTATYLAVDRAIAAGTLRPGVPVARLLVLGKPVRVHRTGPFTDYLYERRNPDPHVKAGIRIRACEGTLLLGETDDEMPIRLFDGSTPAQRALYAFLLAQDGCTRDPLNSGSCEELAEAHRAGKGTPRDPRRARTVLEQSCERGAPPACETLYQWLLAGKLGPREPHTAKQALARACSLGLASACQTHLATLATPRTPPRIRQLWTFRSCRAGNLHDCRLAADSALQRSPVEPLDRALEAVILDHCRDKDAGLCREAARLIDHRRRKQVSAGPPSLRLRYSWYLRACRSGLRPGCLLARSVRRGKRGLPDLASLRRLAGNECPTLGPAYGCHTLAVMRLEGAGGVVDRAGAVEALDRACMGQTWARSCLPLARGWMTGRWGRQDVRKAAGYLVRGCATDVELCADAGRMIASRTWSLPGDDDWVLPALERACVYGGYAPACLERAQRWPARDITEYGHQGPAVRMLEWICFDGRRPSCPSGRRSTVWQRDQRISLSRTHAMQLLFTACQGGFAPACLLHRRSSP